VLVELADDVARSTLRLPPRAVSQALRSLVTNAQDASPANAAIVVAIRRKRDELAIVVRDRGAGIPTDVMARIGEPFFTTKAPGRGMGLGVFLARAVVEGVGGTLHIASVAGDGTEVRVVLPTDIGPPTNQAKPLEPASRRESNPAVMISKPTA
jgi:two-component system sensor histidine kinase RegB